MAQQQGPNKPVGMPVFLGLFVVLVGGILIFFWHARHDQFAYFFLKYAYWIVFPYAKVCSWIGWDSAPPVELIKRIIFAVRNIKLIEPSHVISALNASGYYALPLLYWPLKIIIEAHEHPVLKLRTRHNTYTLMHIQAKNNPCILPVVLFEDNWRAKKMERPASLARSMTPAEWCEKHKLIITVGNEIRLNIEKTKALLFKQLGGKLEDMKNVPDYYKALVVIFSTRILGTSSPKDAKKIIARTVNSRKEAQKMFDQINRSCKPNIEDYKKSFDFSRVASKYDTIMRHVTIQGILKKHSFYKTFIMGLLFEARADGKIPCSQFLWLKLIDRPLFYAIQGVTPVHLARGFSEAAAPFAQFWAENCAIDYDQILQKAYINKAIPAIEKRLIEAGVINKAVEFLEDDF